MSAERPGRLGVGTIGAGRVGAVLASALAGAGHALTGISAVSDSSRERAATMLPSVPVLPIPEIVERSELVLLAVPEAELGPLVAGLAEAGVWQPGQLVLHTAARFGTGVLDPARLAGAIPLAVHPAMSFTGTSIDLARLPGTWFAVTAPAPVLPIGQALVVEMGGEPFIIAEHDRAAYGEAIDTAVSFSSAIVDQASGLLDGIGVGRSGAVLAPLVRSAVENALARHDSGAYAEGADTIDEADTDWPLGGGA
ncbi:Rossmann-like and DUF2520 domain-containing protein [Agromyces badenianii]|uniref:Rossmann-like and DUF2520 domain-containing protein n=1 Tax=Agromyces badenianii TaxID=2080742 RepID=UPI000D590948|nr:Rossmann-like and DUF2520 domain-containing protein [Agromyces badenianii]PWC05113.1 DUF2520 domain-containing protein [Agromyces badenianii]